mgnify:CR=1 FL=1
MYNISYGQIIPEYAKHTLTIARNERRSTIFIFETGMLSAGILGFNMLYSRIAKKKKII